MSCASFQSSYKWYVGLRKTQAMNAKIIQPVLIGIKESHQVSIFTEAAVNKLPLFFNREKYQRQDAKMICEVLQSSGETRRTIARCRKLSPMRNDEEVFWQVWEAQHKGLLVKFKDSVEKKDEKRKGLFLSVWWWQRLLFWMEKHACYLSHWAECSAQRCLCDGFAGLALRVPISNSGRM